MAIILRNYKNITPVQMESILEKNMESSCKYKITGSNLHILILSTKIVMSRIKFDSKDNTYTVSTQPNTQNIGLIIIAIAAIFGGFIGALVSTSILWLLHWKKMKAFESEIVEILRKI